jgi:predicted DsbA family dithiol-disulfide isomerase
LGKYRLEKAINLYKTNNPDVDFKIHYLPYQLSPFTKRPKDKLEYYQRKFGQERFKEFDQSFQDMTRPFGIKVNFGGVISNTFDSHRLIWWADRFNKQANLVEQLCKLYFEENGDIGDHHALADAAEKAGLDKLQVLDFLKGTDGTAEVQELLKNNASNEITGVPHYSFNNK